MITTVMETLSNHALVLSIGWTLIHFLWQAALVGIVTAICLRVMRRSSAQAKYVAGCAGLAVMTLLPIATFAYQIAVADETETRTANSSLAQARDSGIIAVKNDNNLSQNMENAQELANPDPSIHLTWIELDDTAAAAPLGWFSRLESLASALRNWLPWCVMIWMAGVLLLAIRMLFGVYRVWRWQHEGVAVISGELVTAVERLSSRMNLRQRVCILKTARETVPAIVGWIRPAILVPASMLSGLTTAELESILAHELAHVRRYDYPINLLQTVVEKVLFYHPAVWWISNRIREERENCCDDIAIEVCGNRVALARALARMEEIRCRVQRLAIAANGGSLLGRIRRILDTEPVSTGSWWSAGAMVLGSLGLLLGGMWMAVATAVPVERVDTGQIDTGQIVSLEGTELELKLVNKDEKRKTETVLTDSKTKMKQRVFAGIKLAVDREGEFRESSLAMKYTNVMAYSFIPARVAKQLAATELGEIDFGKAAPAKKRPFQAMLKLNNDGLPKPVPVVEPNAEKQLAKPITYVHDLTKPVDGEKTVVPYPDDAVWVPGHLTFYGLNQTQQHRFKIVRIDKVAVGVGPAFGPVNALVLDDANSDFGLLGMDWIQQVRGEKGEGLWFVAAEGALYFMTGNVGAGENAAKVAPVEPTQNRVTVESRGHGEGPARIERPGVKVLATHTYSQKKRVSTGWVEVNRLRSPVDVGVKHDGIIVYQTLMFDIVAVDEKTEKSIWNIDWGKTTPMWQTVSIVELDREGKTELAVELYAADRKTGELVYQYASLKTGQKVEPPKPVAVDSDQQLESKSDGTAQEIEAPYVLVPQQTQQVAAQPNASDDESWGRIAENSGLRSRLTLMTEKPTVGQPILLKLEIKNFGKKPTSVDAQKYEPFRVLRVIQADGKSATFIGMTPQTAGEQQQLKPGESLTLWKNVDANGLFLVKAGRYKFMAEGGEWATQTLWRDSNTIDVQVADGELSPLNQLLEKLSEGLPKKWKVTNGMGLAEGWKGVFLTHTPTSLKRDATGIQIWFTDKKLADDFELGRGDQKQIVTQLGQSKLGFMNVAAQPRTPDIWPGYLEHIRKAAKPLLNR